MILLSFDTEKFGLPREHGVDIDINKSMEVSCYSIIFYSLNHDGYFETYTHPCESYSLK